MGEKKKPKPKDTVMVLEVDLKCCRCYKKVKKVLCKFPEIRDQKYDEGAGKVTITVECRSPEKIMAKLCCKGGGSIKSIEIVETPPTPPPPPPPPPPPIKISILCCHPPGFWCLKCYHGLDVWPCHYGYWRPIYDTCGCGCGCGGIENQHDCTIM